MTLFQLVLVIQMKLLYQMEDMCLECKNNGVFFIINDKESNVVSKVVKDNEKDFEIARVGWKY